MAEPLWWVQDAAEPSLVDNESPPPTASNGTALEEAASSPEAYFVAMSKLAVREAPDANAKEVASISKGEVVLILEEKDDGWFRLSLRGRTDVWVMSKSQTAAMVAQEGTSQFFKALASLQCRNNPDGGADAVISVEKNEILNVQEQQPDGWFRLSLRGREDLWILSKNPRSGKVMVEAMIDAEAALATFEKQEAACESLLSPDEAAKKKKDDELVKKQIGKKAPEKQKAPESFFEPIDALAAQPLWAKQEAMGTGLAVDKAIGGAAPAAADAVSPVEDEAGTNEPLATTGTFFKALSNMAVRDGPSPDKDTICSINKGQIINSLEMQSDGWYRISLRDREDLWVLSKNVKSGKEFVQPESALTAAKTWAKQELSEPSFLSDEDKKKKLKNDAMKAKIAAKDMAKAKAAGPTPKAAKAEEKTPDVSRPASNETKNDASSATSAAPEGSKFYKALANLAVREKPDAAANTLGFSVAKGTFPLCHVSISQPSFIFAG
jgi:uncharacterized protein YgiM (DUF1202 family)